MKPMHTATDAGLADKLQAARDILVQLGSTVVAFSAGVDSTFLLALAVETLGPQKVLAAIGVSPSLARREQLQATELARQIGVELVEVQTCEMDNPQYAANPARRCFHCKSELFTMLKDLATQRGFASVVAGANADDTGDFRPGLDASRDLDVRNPLLEAGLSKQDIRNASRAMGLPTWDKPAMACLASRIPYGDAITVEKLSRVEQAEYALKDLGFAQCRVRDHDTLARIEVPAGQIARAAGLASELVELLTALGYTYVTLDLKGFRSGSMNETL